MIQIRRSKERGHFNHGWLNTYHTFSFADYHDPEWMGFRTLRVINEDHVEPGEGFGSHSHRDTEILTYILKGTLEHKDSMGNSSVIRPGEVQRMSAGAGVTHSEFNPSHKEPVHLLQIWIFPAQKGLTPSYEQRSFAAQEKKNILRLVASPRGDQGSVVIHQDVLIYDCSLENGKSVTYELRQDRGAWVQVIKGELRLNGDLLGQGDGASITKKNLLSLGANNKAEFLFFDLT